MNRVFIVGNITGDIYFDRFMIHKRQRPFLRVILIADRPRTVRGMRVVLWDEKAELYYPYLKKGSELAVIGQFESRMYKDRWVHEVIADNLLLLRRIDWEHGESVRQQYNLLNNSKGTQQEPPSSTGSNAFVAGEVLGNIHYDWIQRKPERGGKYAILHLCLRCDDYLDFLRVVVRGALAELAYPYLQTGSKVAVDGHLQNRSLESGKKAFELTVHSMTFMENINWAAGDANRKILIQEMGKSGDAVNGIPTLYLPDLTQAAVHGD